MIGNEGEAEEDDEENEIQMYPSFIISLSSSQAQLLQFLSDSIQVIFDEKASPYVEITSIVRNDLMLYLCEGFNYLVDNYEKYFYNELIIKRCFKNTSKYISQIEYDDYDNSDDNEQTNEDREFDRSSLEIKKLMGKVIKYHSHVIQAFVAYVSIFSNMASNGIGVDKIRSIFCSNKVLENCMRLIQIIDQIYSCFNKLKLIEIKFNKMLIKTQVLVDSKIISKNEEHKIPMIDIHKTNEKRVNHPLSNFLIKCLTLVGNIVQSNSVAVRYFEREKDKFLVLSRHLKGDFCTDSIKESCQNTINHLTDQSKDIAQTFQLG